MKLKSLYDELLFTREEAVDSNYNPWKGNPNDLDIWGKSDNSYFPPEEPMRIEFGYELKNISREDYFEKFGYDSLQSALCDDKTKEIDKTVQDVLARAGRWPKDKIYYEGSYRDWFYNRYLVSQFIEIMEPQEFLREYNKSDQKSWSFIYDGPMKYLCHKAVILFNEMNVTKFAVYLEGCGNVLIFDWMEIDKSNLVTTATIETRLKDGLKINMENKREDRLYEWTTKPAPFTLEDLKKEIGISGYKMAQETGLSASTVGNGMSNIESLSFKNANAIARAMGFANAGDLITTIEQRNNPIKPFHLYYE